MQLAIAFAAQHPGVTAPIIGPRTMEHLESQLPAASLTLTDDILDRIDEIDPPGTNFSQGDAGYLPPTLQDRFARRRRRG